MIITLNQPEIEAMILQGLTAMNVPHEGAEITMVASRGATGMTAEIKLQAPESPVSQEVPADTPTGPDVTAEDKPEKPKTKKAPDSTAPLFE